MSETTHLNGEEAFVEAALQAGVRVVASYPGSPSSGVVERLAHRAGDGLHVEWSVNERVAFEVAVGASIAGARALAAMKGVGMNVALDPMMVANLVGVQAGLVVLLGDDPGAWASQNDQDSRLLALFTELPLMEPSTPQEGYEMLLEAFALSERISLPVIVRETRRYAEYRDAVAFGADVEAPPFLPQTISRDRASRRWIASTDNAVQLHVRLHAKLETLQDEFEESAFNISVGEGEDGIFASGFAYQKARAVFEKGNGSTAFQWMKLGTLHPLPARRIAAFLEGVRRVLVLEENEPFIERQLKAIAHDARVEVEILGKESGHVTREGELFEWEIAGAIERFVPNTLERDPFHPDAELAELKARQKHGKPPTYRTAAEGLCEGCPYIPTFEALRGVLEERDEHPVFLADPGCGVRLRVEPFEMLDIKYSLSSCIGIACGIAQADPTQRIIAFPGDSAFFHTGITDLINAAYNRCKLLVLVLDNGTTALSGFEPHPGVGVTATGRKQRVIKIEDLARACQIDFVETVNPRDFEATKATFRRALDWDDLAVVVMRDPCPFIEFFRKPDSTH